MILLLKGFTYTGILIADSYYCWTEKSEPRKTVYMLYFWHIANCMIPQVHYNCLLASVVLVLH